MIKFLFKTIKKLNLFFEIIDYFLIGQPWNFPDFLFRKTKNDDTIVAMLNRTKPLALIVLDGWGYRASKADNAIAAAKMPNWEQWQKRYPHTLLHSSGLSVGLPEGQMGNSEVGHMHLGAGRVIYQDLTRIDQAISAGEFARNPILTKHFTQVIQRDGALHLLGLLSPGGVHSHERHLYAILALAKQYKVQKIYVHAFLDGRDTPPRSAATSLQRLETQLQRLGRGEIASICGRYYAMDRDQRWERTHEAYNLIVLAKASEQAPDPFTALEKAYEKGLSDEFVPATLIKQPPGITDKDLVIFTNFRADRARQLSHALLDPVFTHFPRPYKVANENFISLTQYASNLPCAVAFPPENLSNSLGEYLSKHQLSQLRIAETEKYAHVTFFFNGGRENVFPLEERMLIPSPLVATYDQQPTMSAGKITEELVSAILARRYDVIIGNYANADMLGHTGNFHATVTALEFLDECLGQVANALAKVGGEMLITADHGNAEKMFDPITNQPHTAHTKDPVPFIYLGRAAEITHENGSLIDVAPTMLYLLNLPIPAEMTGKSLLKLC